MENLPRDLKVEELLRYEEDDDEFYEKIEAPKFVDFTAPDPFQPYDSSWFCVRIGCDQNHDDVDPDALYRSFVLRVMAARSPNLRLQKTLTKQAPSVLDKCPHSAPAKSAKSRMSRLSSVLASIPQKTIENKVKVSLVTKLTNNGKAKQSSAIAKALTTPKHKKCSQSSAIAKALTTPRHEKCSQSSAIAKVLTTPMTTPKHKKCSQSSAIAKALTTPRHKKCSQSSAIAKAFTTPRHKKCPPNPEPFHSAQNPRVPNAIQKNTRMVVKALSFRTPKKSEKTSLKFHGVPTSDICREIKQLKISNQMNKVPRHHCKSSRCMADDPNHLRPTSSPLKSQSRARKLQRNRIEVPSKYLKKISKPNVQKCQRSVPQEDVHDDSSHMEIDGKLRDGSFNTCPVNGHEESLKDPISANLEVTCATEESLPPSEELSIRKNSLSKLKDFNEDHVKKLESLNIMGDETEASEGSDKGDKDITEEESLPSSDESHNRKNSQSSSYLQETEDETENKEHADQENTVGTAFQVLNSKEQLIPSSGASNQVADELTEVTEPMDIADQENIIDTTEEESLSSSDESHNRENSLSNSDKTLKEIKDETEDKENAGKENTIERTPFRVLGTKELVSSLKASNGRVADEVAEPMDFASKENALASDNNRDMNANIQHAKSKPHQQKACSNAKVTREGKTMKERSATAATAIQGGKYKKSKPTNPKPFRFRTDERGILKEANLEKRMHHHDPTKEPASVSRPLKRQPNGNKIQERGILKEANLEKRMHHHDPTKEPASVSRPLKRQPNGNKIQNRKSLGEERSHGESEKTAEKAQTQKRPTYQTKESKTEMKTEGQKLADSKEKVAQKIRRTTRSPSLQRQLFSPQRGVISQGQLAVIKESSTISRTKEAPSETQAQKSTANTASSRSSSRGKRPATVPKEPNFHSMHVPKSCTKTPTSMIS